MKNIWETWTSALPVEWCQHIIERALKYPAQSSTIGFEDGIQKIDPSYRSSTIRWLEPFIVDKDISDTIMKYVSSSNRSNFGFDISTMNEIQFSEYNATDSGHYDWHHDVWWENPQPFDRKLSVVIQLSDPSEYDGGNFEFFNIQSPIEQFSLQGSLLIFPSFLNHRVLPVTRGTRYSLVTWIEGSKFK